MKSNQQIFHLEGKEFSTADLLNIFKPETDYQIDRLAAYLRTFIGKPLKLTVSNTLRPKSREALGMYFGAIVPATAMDTEGLAYNTESIYEDYRYYRQKGKMSQKHLEVADTMLRLEWHYEYTRRVDGKLYRLPKELGNKDNGALLSLIDKVMEWRNQNGYPYIDIEKYKKQRDSARLISDTY